MAQSLIAYQATTLFVLGCFPRKFPQMLCILTGISPENFRNIEPELFELYNFLSIVMC